MRRPESREIRTSSWVIASLSVGVLLFTGCTAESPAPTKSPTATASASTTPTPSPTPTPTGPVLVPDGTAEDNLALFASVVQTVAASPDSVAGRAYIDALVGAGFDKAAMQITQDVTSVGNPADTIQFSVAWGVECLVGQVGPSTPAPTAVVLPALPSGGCLVGQTRPIDW